MPGWLHRLGPRAPRRHRRLLTRRLLTAATGARRRRKSDKGQDREMQHESVLHEYLLGAAVNCILVRP